MQIAYHIPIGLLMALRVFFRAAMAQKFEHFS